MLLSHHPPCDLDRTWRIGSLRVCVRCLGVLTGAAVALASWDGWSTVPVLAAFIAAVPGVADFTLHELCLSPSNNTRRFLTGASFGVFVAAALSAGLDGNWTRLLLYAVWFCCLQVAATAALRSSGRLEALLTRYEEGARLPRD